MSILSPNLDNYRIEFDEHLFPKELTEKYDTFLRTMNGQIKDIQTLVQSEIISYSTPSITIPETTISGLNNTGKRGINSTDIKSPNTINIDYLSNGNFDEALGSKTLVITMRNVLWNYVYLHELMRLMFERNNNLKEFAVSAVMNSDGDIALMRLRFRNCIVKSLPEITFNHGDSMATNPTFDLTIRFNNYDFEFMLPNFKHKVKVV